MKKVLILLAILVLTPSVRAERCTLIGDSLMVGPGSWPEYASIDGVRFSNQAVGGLALFHVITNEGGVLTKISGALMGSKSVVMALGGNDASALAAKGWLGWADWMVVYSELRLVTAYLLLFPVETIYLLEYHPFYGAVVTPDDVRIFNRILARLADRSNRIKVIRVFDEFAAHPEYTDGSVYPTDAGAQAIARMVEDALK